MTVSVRWRSGFTACGSCGSEPLLFLAAWHIVILVWSVSFTRQDPEECLMSFICSSNNNIARITSLLATIRRTFGTFLCSVRDQSFYAFPSCDTLSKLSETELRGIGLGYRAPYILKSAAMLVEKGGGSWLHTLRSPDIDRAYVQQQLLQFAGSFMKSVCHRWVSPELCIYTFKRRSWTEGCRLCCTVFIR